MGEPNAIGQLMADADDSIFDDEPEVTPPVLHLVPPVSETDLDDIQDEEPEPGSVDRKSVV